MILDGGMGSVLRDIMKEQEIRIPDILTLSAPDAIIGLHLAYLEAGADIISTNTFNAHPLALREAGLSLSDNEVRNLNVRAVKLAREAIDRYTAKHPTSAPKFVAGVVGPGLGFFSRKDNKALSALHDSYRVQTEALLKAGADLLLVETVFDIVNLQQAFGAISETISETGNEPKVMASATIDPETGRLPAGDSLEDFVTLCMKYGFVKSIGLNCCEGPTGLEPHLKTINRLTAGRKIAVSVHPSAGIPSPDGRYPHTPRTFSSAVRRYAENRLVQIIGGCCGTTPEHIHSLPSINSVCSQISF